MSHQGAPTEQQDQSTGWYRGDLIQLGELLQNNGSFSHPDLAQDCNEPGPSHGESEQGFYSW